MGQLGLHSGPLGIAQWATVGKCAIGCSTQNKDKLTKIPLILCSYIDYM